MAATSFAPSTFTFTPTALAVVDEAPGARAIEVAAMLGDSVIGVKHCMNPRGGKVTRATWGFVGGGVAAMIASASAFASAVHTQAINAAAVTEAVAHKVPTWSLRPESVGAGTSLVAFGGLALAISALAMGLARIRRERQTPGYRIGTAAGVEQPVEQAPSADFPLIAAHGDDFVFNFGAGIDGDVTVGGTTTPFAALVAAGHAKASRSVAGAFELPIPHAARIRARAGQTSFVVSSMMAPAFVASTWKPLESRTLKYVVGSLAVHLGIWAVLQQMPVEDSGASIDMASMEQTTISASMTSLEDPALLVQQDVGEDAGDPDLAGASMALESGALGKPTSQDKTGMIQIAKHANLDPQMARQQAIEEAVSAGVLGSSLAIERSIGALTGDGAMSVGFDETNSYNGSVEGTGTMAGTFGFGVSGTGPGGGCGVSDCRGIGTGRYGTIGNGDKVGGTYGIHPGTPSSKLPGHTTHAPPPTIGQPTCGSEGCGPDKALIRRYIKRNMNKYQYCYEKELLSNTTLAGTVSVQFLIAPDGTVQSAQGSGMNETVAKCVASVVKNIAFPRMSEGSVQVNYPFTFRAAGK